MADHTNDNSDEFLANAMGHDQQIIDSKKTGANPDDGDDNDGGDGGEPAPDGKDKDDKGGASDPPDNNEGGESILSEEERQEVSDMVSETINSFFQENPSEETLEIKKELLENFKGSDFDEDGNVLDKDGKIIASYDDVVNHVAEQEGVNYDDDGNQIDDKGNVIATKEELEAENYEANKLSKEWGYEFKDEEGNPKVYPKGKEGIKLLSEDIAEAKNEEFKQGFLNSNPVLTEVAKHLLAGGDLETFDKPVDYNSVSVKDLSNDQMKAYIKKSFIEEGQSEERATKNVSRISDKELKAETEEALNVLNSFEEQKSQARQEKLDQVAAAEDKRRTDYWEKVNKTIEQGELKGFKIPEKERKNFYAYLSTPVDGDKSQYTIDKEKNTLEDSLREAYYRYKGYSLEDNIKDEVNQRTVNTLRAKMAKNKITNRSSNKRIGKRNNTSDISLKELHANK